ncbi:hypothetical protein LOK49_LG13G02840 [Camellia lanceoleosa]|uniref:Uncharacterized protein n=1 Tax=Camellia lanceoleosa TaxID=1840588 RepID=A0ACC0FMT7_9ERIC|nr:hypothetical protein LOK49_LG13G02840 [Camellia lanceoleosa]
MEGSVEWSDFCYLVLVVLAPTHICIKINGTANINAIRAAAEEGSETLILFTVDDASSSSHLDCLHSERCNSEAWIYTWNTLSWEHEVTPGRNRFSIGDGSSICETTESGSACWSSAYTTC